MGARHEPSADAPGNETPDKVLFGVWCVIVLLGALSLVLRFASIGGYSFLVGFGVATIQAALMGVFFMELTHEPATMRIALAACLSLFAILVVLTVADVLTRAVPPLRDPPGTAQRYHG